MRLLMIVALFIGLTYQATLTADTYRVTLLRAAPAYMPQLLEEAKALRTAKDNDLLIMRHSQGDHWDFMLLEPVADNANRKQLLERHQFKAKLAFAHTFLVTSDVSWTDLEQMNKTNALYHIEMFYSAPGKYKELLKQRQMENAYYHATERAGNVIFETLFGNDMDIFTLGFYKDLKTFATDPDLPNEVFEKAATDAGFKSRSDIGFYLRELLSSHQDTLATKVD